MSYSKNRAMTPKGQMSGGNSGPAIMMMPPHIRATFMPNPPIKHLPSFQRHVLTSDNYIDDDDTLPLKAGKAGPSGVSFIPHSFPPFKKHRTPAPVSSYLQHFERSKPPPRVENPTRQTLKRQVREAKRSSHQKALQPLIESYKSSRGTMGEHPETGMNCYNTLFVGRLAYEASERKLLREFEQFGPVKDVKLITCKDKKSRGYAFIEYEHEEDMKRAYRSADGMRIEGRPIVVDVERGHTVPNWLPRRLGGGLGGTRLGGMDVNVFYPGRFDPNKKPEGMTNHNIHPMEQHPVPPHGRMGQYNDRPPYGGGPNVGYMGRYDNGPPPPPPSGYHGRETRGPPRDERWDSRGGGGGYEDRKRRRSRSPDRDRRRGRY